MSVTSEPVTSEPGTDVTQTMLEDRVRRWRREAARAAALDGLLRLSGSAAALLTVALWVDQSWSLSQGARWLSWLLGVVALPAAARAWVLRPARGVAWGAVLDAAAVRYPCAADYLKSAWELRCGAPPGTSEVLRRAHLARAEEEAARIPSEPLFRLSFSRSSRWAGAAGAAALLSWPGLAASPAWERTLAPWRDVPLERFVAIAPGDAAVPWGEDARVEASWSAGTQVGRAAGELTLWVRETGGWRAARWDAVTKSRASFIAEGIAAPLSYRLSWRGLRSRVYRLVPAAAARWDSLRARAGGGQEQAWSAVEPLAALRGTWVAISGRPNQALKSATLSLSDRPAPVALRPGRDGSWEGSFQVFEDAEARFELEPAEAGTAARALSYAVRALKDEPPSVELLSPLMPVQAGRGDVLPVAYSAKDDGGLSRLALLVKVAGAPPREIELERPAGAKERLGDYAWDLSALPLGPIEFRVKAVDGATPPQESLSAPGTVEIADFESAHAKAVELGRRAQERLRALAEREARLAELALKASSQYEGQARATAAEWSAAAAAAEELAEAMVQDAYANPGAAQQARTVAESARRAARQEMPAALADAQAGRWAQAARRHERLAAQLSQAARALAEGRRLQSLQDLFGGAGRLKQSGESLEAAVEALLGRERPPSTEESRRLAQELGKLQERLRELQKTLEGLPRADPQALEEAQARAVELPLESARRSAEELADALSRGDYAKAAELARQLSEDLSRLQQGLASAATMAASQTLAGEAAKKLEQLKERWATAVEEQQKALEKARALEDRRLESQVEAQKALLGELAVEQAVLVSSAQAQGTAFPAPPLGFMKGALAEFEARKVKEAPALLQAAVGALAASHPYFSRAERQILNKLETGASGSKPAPDAQSAAAAEAQGRARGVTAALQEEVEGLAAELGASPGQAGEALSAALGEQAAAEGALARGDSQEGARRSERALEHLLDGSRAMSQAAAARHSVAAGLTGPFSRQGAVVRVLRVSGGAGAGAQLGFVALPSAKDYLPPQEIRRELEKSLRERRPASYDKTVKEYFRRISQ